jgi:hypothetical protein
MARPQVALPMLAIGLGGLGVAAATAWWSASPAIWAAGVAALFAVGLAGCLVLRLVVPALPVTASPTLVSVLAAALFVVGTAVAWLVDFRNAHFFTTGLPVVLFNVWRLLLLVFFIAMFRGAGCGLRKVMERRFATSLADGRLERLAVDGILGVGVWIAAMYAAGILGIYFRPLAFAAALIAIAVGVRETARDMMDAQPAPTGSGGHWSAVAAAGLGLLVGVLVAALALRLGLAGLADEYDSSHYLPYYELVVRNHDTSLNDYWYHFWVTKGAGLQFLAALVGDVFSPALMAFALLLLTACFVASFVRRSLPGSAALPLAAVVLFLSPFLTEFHYQQKQHFVAMGLIVAAVWTGAWLCRPGAPTLRPGLVLLTLLSVTAVLCVVPFAAPLSLWLGLLGIGLTALKRPRQHAVRFLVLAWCPLAVTLATALFVLGFNMARVGMAEASPFKLFFEHADQSRLARYVSPYLVLFLEEASEESTGRMTWERLYHPDWAAIGHVLHLDYLPFGAKWLVALVGAAVLALALRRVRERLAWPIFSLLAAMAGTGLLSMLVSQPDSLFRAYLFTLPLAIITLVVGVASLIGAIGDRRAALKDVASALIATALAVHNLALAGAEFYAKKEPDRFARSLRFVSGRDSLATTIGTLATCEKMASTFGREKSDAKAWTLTFLLPVGCYLLPQPRVLMEVSTSMGPHWHRIVFGPADVALSELERLGVSHFYVDLADYDPALDNSSTSLMGCLAYSPLFDPKSLKRHFRVIWRDGDAFLLATARAAPNGTPLPDEFVSRWSGKRDKTQYGLGEMGALCRRVADYYAVQGERWPVRADRTLPPIKGWQ